jgi:hypothetical protein
VMQSNTYANGIMNGAQVSTWKLSANGCYIPLLFSFGELAFFWGYLGLRLLDVVCSTVLHFSTTNTGDANVQNRNPVR